MPPSKLWSWVNLPLLPILNTVPKLFGPPPPEVVPYRLPEASCSSIPNGYAPSLLILVKLCSAVSLPFGLSLYTTPQPACSPTQLPFVSPPNSVVPYRFPLASRMGSAIGIAPSEPPVKLCSTVSFLLLLSRNKVPERNIPPSSVVPSRLPCESGMTLHP